MLRCQERALCLEANSAWQCQPLAARIGDRITQTQALAHLRVGEDEVIVQSYSLGITSLDRRKNTIRYFMARTNETQSFPDKHGLSRIVIDLMLRGDFDLDRTLWSIRLVKFPVNFNAPAMRND